MGLTEDIEKLESGRKNTRMAFLLRVCQDYFGNPRINGSHHIFKTPWKGDPRINLQRDGNKAKPYQVDQVVAALRKVQEQKQSKAQDAKGQEE